MSETTTVGQLATEARHNADRLARESQDQHADDQAAIAESHHLRQLMLDAETLQNQHRAAAEHSARLSQIHAALLQQLRSLHHDALEG